MYCPECLVEYRDGFTKCADCGASLVAGAPPQEKSRRESSPEMVTVWSSNNRVAIALAEASLEEAGISFYAQDDETLHRFGPFNADVRPWCRILVEPGREAEARSVLEPIEATSLAK